MKALKTTVHYDVTAGRTHTEQTELSVMDEAMNTEHIVESNVVGIYPDYTFQMMEGYGCSLTESALQNGLRDAQRGLGPMVRSRWNGRLVRPRTHRLL